MSKTVADVASSRSGMLLRITGGLLGPLLALVCVVAFFVAADEISARSRGEEGTFATLRNARTIAVQTCVIGVGALGMTLVIIAGGIDLSVGTALALSATVLAYFLAKDYSPLIAIAAGIIAGCLAGLVNGVLVSLLGVVPFIITLGTMTIYKGFAKLLASETTIRPLAEQTPKWIENLVAVQPEPPWPLVSGGVWLMLILAAILAAVLRYTVFGRYVFAIGSNESTARLCGINVPLVKVAVYTLAGLFVGAAGMLQFARLSSGNPTSGEGLELQIIAAVVIGGGSLSGGRGSVLGSLAGAAMIRVIYSGCTQLGLKNPIQDMILGAIIIAAVAIDQLRQRRLAA